MNTRKFRFLALAALLLLGVKSAAEKAHIDVQEIELPNGMRFLLYEQHDSPTVAAAWVAHVGSANERPGITGLSHFFEHMMFKGTHVIGTKNIQADLQLIQQQEELREQMRTEMSHMRDELRRGKIDDLLKPENWTPRYRELEQRFDVLVQKQRETIIKDQMDQIYTKNGGEGLNAFTNEDMTGYFIRVPKNRLELWAWMESDRLANPVFREFYSERDVVFEERRMRTESTPLGRYDEAFSALFWQAHPYSWPVVGWASDIPSYTKAQADDYFKTYYAPNNLTGVLVGDFQVAEVRPLLLRYFGRLKAGPKPPEVVTLEPTQIGEQRYSAEAETPPTVRVWWKAVPFVHKDRVAYDLLSDLLSGRTGRLYKGLVLGRGLANQVEAGFDPMKYGGIFNAEIVVKDDKDPAEAERALYEEIEKLQQAPVPAEELQKVKNQAKANAYRRLSSPFFILAQLIQYDGRGDWQFINTYSDEVDALTAEDVRRVARNALTKENRTVGTFLRKAGAAAAPEDPELQALPPEARAQVSQNLKRIAAETDAAKLKGGIAQMQAAAGQVPAEMKPAFELMLKRAQERLAALESEKK
jgi:predicted Zn-dependent peptidase